MSKLKQFVYEDSIIKLYYLAEKECDDYGDAHDQIWHREDGPAYIEHYKDGTIEYEDYWVNDNLHREDGPAWIWYDKDGNIEGEEYYLDGKEYTKEEYDRELRKRNTKIGRELYE